MTKINKVLKHLMNGNSINKSEAACYFRIYGLGDVIMKLRNKGYNIKTTMIESENLSYANYSLSDE